MNVLTIYRSLDAEQKRILAEKRVELNRPVEDLIALFRPLAACDASVDKARTALGCTLAVAIVAIIPALILAGNAGWAVGGPVLIGLVILAIGLIVLYRWTRNVDLSNNLRQFVLPVFSVLKEDFAPGEPVHVKLDLRPPTSREKKTGESQPYKQGAYYKIIDRMYVDSWMDFDATLADGSRLSWQIEDTIRERTKTKKNPRGKIKTKTKYKKKSSIEVKVAMRSKTYSVSKPLEGRIEAGENRNKVRVEHRESMASLEPLAPKTLIDLVARIYGSAEPARKGA
jgi:hypothetical protein